MNDNERMISREYIRRLMHHTIRLLVCVTLISSSVYAQPTPPVNDSLYLNLEQLFALGTKANLQLTADRLQEQAAYERSRTPTGPPTQCRSTATAILTPHRTHRLPEA